MGHVFKIYVEMNILKLTSLYNCNHMIFFFTLLLMRIQVVLIIYDCKFMAFSFVTININGLIEEKKQMWYIF